MGSLLNQTHARSRKIIAITIILLLIVTTFAANLPPCTASTWSNEEKLTNYSLIDMRPAITQTSDNRVWIVWQRNFWGDLSIMGVTYNGSHWSDEKPLIRRDNLVGGISTGAQEQSSEGHLSEESTSTFNLVIQSPPMGGGTTNPTPGTYPHYNGTIVSVLAIPNEGYYFDKWYLNVTYTKWLFNPLLNPTNVTVDDNYTLTPVFSTTSTRYQHSNPSITQLSNGTIMIVWCAKKNLNKEELYCTTSSDGGSTWSSMTRLTSHIGDADLAPAVMQAKNGTIWVVWASKRQGQYDIYYKTHDVIWSAAKQLTNDTYIDSNPYIIQTQDRKIWIVWNSYSTGDNEIHCKTYDGTWSEDENLSLDSSKNDSDPTIFQMRNGTIWILWASCDFPSTDNDLYYKISTDNGINWSSAIQFTTDSYEDMTPTAMQTKLPREVWVVWASNRADQPDGNYEIWYHKTIVLNGDVNEDGVVDIEDLVAVALYWGKKRGDSYWDPVADLNDDEVVNIRDLIIIGLNFGRRL